jgi:hypothetical protein
MALDAFTRAVRALDMNLDTINQPQQPKLAMGDRPQLIAFADTLVENFFLPRKTFRIVLTVDVC